MFDIKRHPLNYYEEQVKKMEQEPIREGGILFYGSSGFTRWSRRYCTSEETIGTIPVEEAIRARDGSEICINHAFGGSTTEELLYYYPRLVRPWKPKALIITSYANDWGFGYGTAEIMMLLSRLLAYARTDMPGIRLYITDRRPNAKNIGKKERAWDEGAWMNTTKEMNDALTAYCREHDDTTLIRYNDFDFLFDEGHTGDWTHVRPEMFVEDQVHFTKEGYEHLTEKYKEILKDEL